MLSVPDNYYKHIELITCINGVLVPPNTVTRIPADSRVYDTDNAWDKANTRITIPSWANWFSVDARIQFAQQAFLNGSAAIFLYQNGANYTPHDTRVNLFYSSLDVSGPMLTTHIPWQKLNHPGCYIDIMASHTILGHNILVGGSDLSWITAKFSP